MLAPFLPRPGVVKTETEYSQEGNWVDADKTRFYKRLPQKIGGWEKHIETQLTGANRGTRIWRDDLGRRLVAFGTNSKLFVLDGGDLLNITPLDESGTLTDPFTTTDASTLVSVADTSHGRSIGDAVFFSGATAVGGITIDGEYAVVSVTDTDNYVIQHSAAATSSAGPGGGSVDFEYEISPGNASQFLSYGYGTGTYGTGTYGTPRSASTFLLSARTWTMDAWAEDLIACPRGGNIYVWDRSAGGRATLIANAPISNAGIFVTDEKTIVALGAGGDRRAIAWCDLGDYTTWTPAAANSAGAKDLAAGSPIVAGIKAADGTNLVFTEDQCFALIFVPTNTVYQLRQRGSGAGLIAPLALVEWNGIVYWMSNNDFYAYAGIPTPLPRQDDVKGFVFDNLTPNQRDKCFAGFNPAFGEVWFFYPTIAADEPDAYVIYSLAEQCFAPGTLTRTSWAHGKAELRPLATTEDGYVMEHETGVDDDGAAIDSYVTSAPIDLGDGDVKMDITGIVPDIYNQVGAVEVTLYTRDKPKSVERIEGPYTLYDDSELVDTRANGRQVAVKFQSNVVGGNWRLGKTRFHVKRAGGRR